MNGFDKSIAHAPCCLWADIDLEFINKLSLHFPKTMVLSLIWFILALLLFLHFPFDFQPVIPNYNWSLGLTGFKIFGSRLVTVKISIISYHDP